MKGGAFPTGTKDGDGALHDPFRDVPTISVSWPKFPKHVVGN